MRMKTSESPPVAPSPVWHAVLAFDGSNRLAVRHAGGACHPCFLNKDPSTAREELRRVFPDHTTPSERFVVATAEGVIEAHLVQIDGPPTDPSVVFATIDHLSDPDIEISDSLRALLAGLAPRLHTIPYLHLDATDFIYKFRPEKERNTGIYALDSTASALYQSKLCAAIKERARAQERTAGQPVTLHFGAVEYVIPSHFGFCLGVKNAIERAYETLAANPGRRVFMLSELIHNPFVNADLLQRGLRYLQTDKGAPYTVDGTTGGGNDGAQAPLLWDTLTPEDIVIIPAFGATDEDKARLVRKGIAVCAYDATCMLVEKVWKAARAYGRSGYTVIIHGKAEHEETKATFSNTRRHAPAVIVRNLDEVRALGGIIASDDPRIRARFFDLFAGKHTPGFDVDRDLERVAVVNQTTLLMNETLEIVEHLKAVYHARHGSGDDSRVGGGARRDTLCYATQVNQDALTRALEEPLDAAFVIGGKNSSNTFQLYRLCEQRLPGRAFFIHNESSIRSRDEVEHYVFPAHGPGGGHGGHSEVHALWPGDLTPKRVLITGGASCPDGLIQQVIARINALWPADQLRSIDEVVADLETL